MHLRIAASMGNCIACRETAAGADSPLSPSTPPIGPETKDVPIYVSRSGQHRHSLTVVEHSSNGNSKIAQGVEICGSLHREKSLRVIYCKKAPITRSESKQKEVSDTKLYALFDLYKDADSNDIINAEGMECLLNDLNLAPDEFKVLILAWRLNAENMCQFTREEFTTGLKALRADSLPLLNTRLSEVAQDVLHDPELFKDLYRFTFRFGLDKTIGQRILPTDMAVSLWRIIFSQRPSPLLDSWLEYLAKTPGGGIPKDTWQMFLHLLEQLGGDLSLYDDSHAWPSVFDDFVEHENDRMNQNVAKNKDDAIIEDCA